MSARKDKTTMQKRRRFRDSFAVWGGATATCVASLGLLTALSPTTVQAQQEQEKPAATTVPLASAADTREYEKVAVLDFAKLYKAQALESESLVTVRAVLGKRASLEMRHKVKLTIQRPDRFRAEVTLLNVDGSDNARYTILSDGAKVITYRPGKMQYSVATLADFLSDGGGQESFASMGVLGALLFSRDLADGIAQVTPQIADVILDSIRQGGGGFTIARETVENLPRTVVSFDDAKGGFKIRMHLREGSGEPMLADVSGKDKANEFRLTESVTRFDTMAAPDPSLFRFTPPAGVKKIEKVVVEIFPADKPENL